MARPAKVLRSDKSDPDFKEIILAAPTENGQRTVRSGVE